MPLQIATIMPVSVKPLPMRTEIAAERDSTDRQTGRASDCPVKW